MGYKPKGTMDIYDIVTRWHTGHSISEISQRLIIDRKTVRRYVQACQQRGLKRSLPLPEREELLKMIRPLAPVTPRRHKVRDQFAPYRDEIIDLITRASAPLKPKTVYEVVCAKYGVEASYSTYKRFVRSLRIGGGKTIYRLESEPGMEVQIDYAKVGRLRDPNTGKNRNVYAFIGTLSYSRYKYVEFTFTQSQQSFVSSHLRMFAFFGGVPRLLVIDNLKSGVIKPDRYDPVLNPLYRAMSEHYGSFIDPARVRAPKDKGKVERTVPPVRELFKKLDTIYEDLCLNNANGFALEWCRTDDGLRRHGTTGEKPAEAFAKDEFARLLRLPADPFEMAVWKQVRVHADQYIQFEKRFYTLPKRFVSHRLWVRGTEKKIKVYDKDFRLVKQHVRSGRLRTTDPSDFPLNLDDLFGDRAVKRLLQRASVIGPGMRAYIYQLLKPHAKINFRKAQGVLGLAESYPPEQLEEAALFAKNNQITKVRDFKTLLQDIPPADEPPIPISAETSAYVRKADYFIHLNT